MAMPGMDMPKQEEPPKNKAPSGLTEVTIAPVVQQRIGVTLGKVEQTPLTMTIRAVGIVRLNETKVAHIHLKTEGWIKSLSVSFTGQRVQAGDPMLSIYSPAFLAAQGEFLSALRSAKATLDGVSDRQLVADTARQRLELWDIPKDELDKLEKGGKPIRYLTLRSPISGTVLEKMAFEGQYVTPDRELYVVGDLSTVWMQAKVYQYELPHLALGMPLAVSFPWPAVQQLAGKIVFIDPVVDETSRTVQVRVELPNPDGQLKPGMFGDIVIKHEMGSGLTVPTSAILRSGQRDIAFRALPGDRFAPVEVKISPIEFGDRFQILEGLQAGDVVATSANFLIDSESRLEVGAGSMAGMPGMSPTDTSVPKQTTTSDMGDMDMKETPGTTDRPAKPQ
jgi:Cu(I)/Ag(I) efflux system membrane fusion protein